MMERAAVAIRTIATAPTDESDATATLGTLQQTREQIAPWADNKSGTLLAWPAKCPLDLLKSSPRCRKQFIGEDRKSTRLNSSHLVISYAVFCLKKKNKKNM